MERDVVANEHHNAPPAPPLAFLINPDGSHGDLPSETVCTWLSALDWGADNLTDEMLEEHLISQGSLWCEMVKLAHDCAPKVAAIVESLPDGELLLEVSATPTVAEQATRSFQQQRQKLVDERIVVVRTVAVTGTSVSTTTARSGAGRQRKPTAKGAALVAGGHSAHIRGTGKRSLDDSDESSRDTGASAGTNGTWTEHGVFSNCAGNR